MDTGKGYMAVMDAEKARRIIDQHPEKENLFFHLGEEVQVKASTFVVCKITPKKLTLRIKPRAVSKQE